MAYRLFDVLTCEMSQDDGENDAEDAFSYAQWTTKGAARQDQSRPMP